ncbi:MAG: hypothetical protein ACOH1R_00690 [Luteimonas sp.]
MTADHILTSLAGAARRRLHVDAWLHAMPWLCVLLALAWRLEWTPWTLWLLACAIAAAAWFAWRAARLVDARWLARRLDAVRTDMEDSAALLFPVDGIGEGSSTAHELPGTLQQLQRARLRQRLVHGWLESGTRPDLRPRWRTRTLSISALLALIALVAIVSWPARQGAAPGGAVLRQTASPGAAIATPRLLRQRLDIHPPAYTGLPARQQATLDANVPAGATVQWTLRFSPAPMSADLVFHDGQRLALRRSGEDWVARRRIDASALYRLVLPTPLPAAQSGLHRIDVVADQPPVLRALQPDRNLSLRSAGQRAWALVFEAEDDHGLAPTARLHITQTEGDGETITAKQRDITLTGRGSARRKRYAHTIDLASLGLVEGNDLIVQLSVSDNRAPRTQSTRSPSFILRWPLQRDQGTTDMDGLVKTALPAYFRSQRQIIIDAEALQAQKRTLDAAHFIQRSDGIGVDQHSLRLRYGQFLGEQSEGAPLLPTNDAGDEAHADAPPARTEGHDDHAAVSTAPAPAFGSAGAAVAEYGHTHDQPEAATLLDPGTQTLLRAALDQMWQSELNLRQGKPDAALPFAYKALGLIKRVQQASRIYLARSDSESPPIDESRRLGGDRSGLGNRGDVLSAATAIDPVPAAAWRALQELPPTDRASPDRAALDYGALERWARAHTAHATDPLALFVAIDAARRDPACAPCRERLRRALWPLLPRSTATTGERQRADAAGRAYLDALGSEGSR